MERDLIRTCTHIKAVGRFGEEAARARIVERFHDGMPAPCTFQMSVNQVFQAGPVSIYLYNEEGQPVIEVDLDYPMVVGPGDEIRLQFRGISVQSL